MEEREISLEGKEGAEYQDKMWRMAHCGRVLGYGRVLILLLFLLMYPGQSFLPL